MVAALALRGIDHIVAADFSAARRSMAAQLGAHEVVDSRDEAAFAAWRRTGGLRNLVVFEAIDVSPMITGEVDLDGVAGASAALADPDQHCKILVIP